MRRPPGSGLVALPAFTAEKITLSLVIGCLLRKTLAEHALAEITVSSRNRLWTPSSGRPRARSHHDEGHEKQYTLGEVHRCWYFLTC